MFLIDDGVLKSLNNELVAADGAGLVQERHGPERVEPEVQILVLGRDYFLLTKLLDVSLDRRHNFDPSVFVPHLEVADELLRDEAALLVAEVVGDQECRLLLYEGDVVPQLVSEGVAVDKGAHVGDHAHLDVAGVKARHVWRRYVDRLACNYFALFVDFKDIETNCFNRLLTFFQEIRIRVRSTSDVWQEFAFLSVVNNIQGLDINFFNEIHRIRLEFIQCHYLGFIYVSDKNNFIIIINDAVLATIRSIHFQDIFCMFDQEEERLLIILEKENKPVACHMISNQL